MTRFNHQQRNGKRKQPKERERTPIGIADLDALVLHREMEFLRRPTRFRAYKLAEAQRRRDKASASAPSPSAEDRP